MRTLVIATLFMITTAGAAFADESVAGNWHANLGQGVTINMSVSPDGNWSSDTYQKNSVVREMRGTYTQTHARNGEGVMVFTPTQASTQGGAAEPETDRYQLAQNGNQLKLTSGGDTMVFEKQTKH